MTFAAHLIGPVEPQACPAAGPRVSAIGDRRSFPAMGQGGDGKRIARTGQP